jgi:hypothetical protein
MEGEKWMKKIVIKPGVVYKYKAMLEGSNAYIGVGNTAEDAIGRLIIAHPRVFGVSKIVDEVDLLRLAHAGEKTES